MLMQAIRDQIKDAMRAKEPVKLDTLRYILSTLKYVEIEKQRELTDEEVVEAVSKEVKKRKDAIELFKNSGRDVLVSEEEAKLAVIMTLLPKQLSAQEIEQLIDEAIAEVGKENMGAIMKALGPKTKGRADGKLVSELVRQKMTA